MIVYTPFWETLKNSSETTYTLIHKHNISAATLQRIRNNQCISTRTLNDLCLIFKCDLNGIAKFIAEEKL